jgi:transposase-like protein
MAAKRLPDVVARRALDAYLAANENYRSAARTLGISEATLRHQVMVARERRLGTTPGVAPEPGTKRPIGEHDQATRRRALSLVRELGSVRAAAVTMNLPASTVHSWVKSPAKALGTWEDKPEAAILRAPGEERPVAEILRDREREFDRHANAHTDKLIPVKVKLSGPVGILHFGDPHLDNPGCDIYAVQRHVRLVQQTEGMFAASVGDMQDNWIGRLAMEWANSTTTASEAWKLVEWFVHALAPRLLYLIGGNHDAWSGAGDPLRWISAQAGTQMQPSEARLQLVFPNGREVRINARHDFAGTSQYNPAHGQMKAALFGTRDHVNISGHKHTSGYGVLKCMHQGILMHCIQVASYKLYDRYARDRGFRDQNISPACVTIIDPDAEREEDLVTMFWSPERAAEVLTALRSKRKENA